MVGCYLKIQASNFLSFLGAKKLWLATVLVIFAHTVLAATPVFKLHLLVEPTALSPLEQRNSAAGYLLSQVYAPLLKMKDGKTYPFTAKCEFKGALKVHCRLIGTKWSDGSPLLATDYVRSFDALADPKLASFQKDLVNNIKLSKAVGDTLEIELKEPDPDFLFTLAHPLLSPVKDLKAPAVEDAQDWIVAGPYKIAAWKSRQSIRLTPNPFWKDAQLLPDVEFLFVSEDSIALGLYEKGELGFLRRVPTLYLDKVKNRADFHKVPQFRFDYVGFSEKLSPQIRKALSESLDFNELQKIFSAAPRPGCPGIPKYLATKNVCVDFNPKTGVLTEKPSSLIFAVSKQGGDDHKRMGEWAQAQWRQRLNLKVDLQQPDDKIFVSQLKELPPTIFRKGINPERPICHDVLEVFKSDSNENYIRLKDKKFDRIVDQMKTASSAKRKQLCTEGLQMLISNHWIVPTGPIYFAILAKPEWTGWSLNELNQLDLSHLRHK